MVGYYDENYGEIYWHGDDDDTSTYYDSYVVDYIPILM